MWIDSDTMIINPTFQLPFNKFVGKDLIIWGNETALLSGDGRSGAHAFPLPPPPISQHVLYVQHDDTFMFISFGVPAV